MVAATSSMSSVDVCSLLWDFMLLNVRIMCVLCHDVYQFFVPPAEKSLSNKVILITGAGGAMGRELAVQLARLGARLVLCDVDEESLRRSGGEVQTAGGEVSLYRCDVTSLDSVQDMATRVQLEVGQVSCVIHSHGVYHHKPFLQHTDSDIQNTLDVNVLGTMWVTRAFLGQMVSSNSGQVVFLSSVLGVMGRPLLAPYCASKFAITGFCDALSQELEGLGADGVKTTIVHPFLVGNIEDVTVDIRVPGIFDILSPEEAASLIIEAMRRDQSEIFLPKKLKPLMRINRCLPRSMRRACQEFVEKK